MEPPMPADEPRPIDQSAPEERWEIADQWQQGWRTLKWAFGGFVTIGALVVVGQVFLFYQMFSEIHWSLGWSFAGLFAGLCFWFIAMPLFRFLQSPAIAEPPKVDLSADTISAGEIADRITYDAQYLKGMARNPALVAKQAEILKVQEELRLLKTRATAADVSGGRTSAAKELAALERDRIAPLLSDLDKQVDSYIHKEAIAVGASTTVSLNGSVDAFIVLWRNINMVARISRLYYGRPSLRLSMMILRDVMTAVLLSRALDDVTDAAGEALGGLVTRLGGLVVGPMIDGSVNALMTTKLGYLAKKRCRSFDVWNEAKAQRATRDVLEQVKKESASLINDVVKASSGFIGAATNAAGGVVGAAGDAVGAAAGIAAGAAGKVMKAPKSAWSIVQDAFIKRPGAAKPGNENIDPG